MEVLTVIIGGNVYAFPCEPKSTAPESKDRYEENLHFGARDTLENVRNQYGTATMMHAYKQIAKWYEVDADELLKIWVRHYGPSLVWEE